MAKHNGKRSASEQTSDAAEGNTQNGALLFEDMGDDFVMPSKLGGSEWDAMVTKILATEKGKKGFPVIKIFEGSPDSLSIVYTRAKQLKNAVTRAEAAITVAVRRLPGDGTGPVVHAVLAQRNAE